MNYSTSVYVLIYVIVIIGIIARLSSRTCFRIYFRCPEYSGHDRIGIYELIRIIVGGYALTFHGAPRYRKKDLADLA